MYRTVSERRWSAGSAPSRTRTAERLFAGPSRGGWPQVHAPMHPGVVRGARVAGGRRQACDAVSGAPGGRGLAGTG